MKKLSIEQAEPIRKKFAPDWEIRKGKYLYKKVAFDDYNQALRFFMVIEKPQIKLDHFADIGFFYNEVILMVYTHDVGGLTQLDFELALYIDEALKKMGARQLEEAMPYTGQSPQYKGKRLPTDDTADAKDITKKSKKVDMPDEPTDFDFGGVDKEKLKKVVAKLVPQLNHPVREKVIRARFGLPPFTKSYTLDQIADALGVGRERVRQIEARALRQLKHPKMSTELRPFLDHIEEKWSASYKKSIDCNNPKGFSQKAHCAGRKKK